MYKYLNFIYFILLIFFSVFDYYLSVYKDSSFIVNRLFFSLSRSQHRVMYDIQKKLKTKFISFSLDILISYYFFFDS